MIKSVILTRQTDGLVLCQSNDGYMDQLISSTKLRVKKYHAEVTAYLKNQNTGLKQIDNSSYGIFFKVNDFVVFTCIVDKHYPAKLAGAFIESIISPFFDEVKCQLGAGTYRSKLQNISSDHYFIKFDRNIKLKKKQFQDPTTSSNVDRMKKQLEIIHETMRQNMNLIKQRQDSLNATQQRAKRINQQSKKFDSSTKKLVWHYWIKKNLIWIVLVILILLIYFLVF